MNFCIILSAATLTKQLKIQIIMKQLRVSVYRTADLGDGTNGGVTSRHDRMTLFYGCRREEALQHCKNNGIDPDGCLVLVERTLWGEQHNYAAPLVHQSGKCGPMFGGNFVYTSDRRIAEAMGTRCSCPVQVHDRYETTEEYASYSN